MNERQETFLRELGLITDKDKVRPEHLDVALKTLASTNVNNKAHNRHTGTKDTLASLVAAQIGRSRGYVTREMAFWLGRFRANYDPYKQVFWEICPQKMVEIITPWQLLYLISLEYNQL